MMGKYLVVGYKSKGEVAVFNIDQGGPPVRHPFPAEGGAAPEVRLESSADDLLCDEYQIFLFGKIYRPADFYPPYPPPENFLNVVDFLSSEIDAPSQLGKFPDL